MGGQITILLGRSTSDKYGRRLNRIGNILQRLHTRVYTKGFYILYKVLFDRENLRKTE